MSRTREILSNACKFHESAITLPMDNKHPASITSFGSGRGAFLFSICFDSRQFCPNFTFRVGVGKIRQSIRKSG